ncbi:hypothetical protein WJX73_002194 [Symbiochloris irregularis]|uniref:Uncharacterized protein n=1 Tax=Symbiochloris irregularis TaxID=706552 RepID=A0AAW1NS27_9CHLO
MGLWVQLLRRDWPRGPPRASTAEKGCRKAPGRDGCACEGIRITPAGLLGWPSQLFITLIGTPGKWTAYVGPGHPRSERHWGRVPIFLVNSRINGTEVWGNTEVAPTDGPLVPSCTYIPTLRGWVALLGVPNEGNPNRHHCPPESL